MHNSTQIDNFCRELAKEWKKVPQWRFGQFLTNTLTYKGNLFYLEDEEIVKYIKDFVEAYCKV